MIRLFEQHHIRFQKELEGYWDFSKASSKNTLPSSYDKKLYVPGCWESNIELCDYRGYGVYKKTIQMPKYGNLRLNFKGISHTVDIYFDGTLIDDHYNAFTEFSTVISNVSKGSHTLVLVVDNTFTEDSSLHIPNDYYAYGGITRPVVMEIVPDVYIKHIQFTPYLLDSSWHADIKIIVSNCSSITKSVRLQLDLDDTLLESDISKQEIDLPGNTEKAITTSIAFDNVHPWSPKNPYLYLLHAYLYEKDNASPVDDLIERVGFRTIEVKGQEILLNNSSIFMQGFNRHEDFNIVGSAIPMQLAAIDMDIMTDLGSNAVRTSHYPNDERFLDMCDEKGILVWEENHARGLELEQMLNPNFENQCRDCIDEMVTSHYNHPSIILWGILNECASDTEEGRRMYQTQFEQIKTIDQSRPLTFATCKHFNDLCLDFVDLVSINIYHAWYHEGKTVEELEKAYLKEYEWIQTTDGKGKPIIISEFGGGAIYGYRAPHRPKWSEERQVDILKNCLELYLNRPEIVGTFIWQYCDCRVTDEVWGIKRPRSQNNKGIVDEYRRPKLAYETVKQLYRNNAARK